MAENNQSITTYVAKKAAQDEAHPEYTPSLEDVLYVVHGTGSDRDRLYTLQQIATLIASGTGLNPLILKDYDNGGFWKVELTGETIEFTRNNGGTETPNKITFNLTNGLVLQNTLTGTGVTRTYEVQVGTDGYSVSDANPSGTFTAEMKGGIVRAKRGNDGSAMDYEKVTTPLVKADSIEGTSTGTGSAGAKEVVVKSGLHIKNDDGGSHYLRVEGASTFEGSVEHKYDVHLTCHGSQTSEVDANLAVDGKTTSKILQVGLDANKALEADSTGVKIHKTCTFNAGINIGGIVIDCSAETGAVLVNNVIADAGITELGRVVVLYCVSGQTVTKGTGTNAKSITLTDNVALPFYISGTALQPWPIPMFIADWT